MTRKQRERQLRDSLRECMRTVGHVRRSIKHATDDELVACMNAIDVMNDTIDDLEIACGFYNASQH